MRHMAFRFLLTRSVMLLALLLAACGGPMRGSGQIETESRDVRGITTVELDTSGNLIIAQGDAESLTIEADDNILPLLTSEVVGGTLRLRTRPNTSMNPTRIVYTLTVTDLRAITVNGSGGVTTQALTADTFTLTGSGSGGITVAALQASLNVFLNGSGNITVDDLTAETVSIAHDASGTLTLSGTATSQTAALNGSGTYAGDGLRTQRAHITVNGSGSAAVNVSETLNAVISGSGSITYSGSPTVTTEDDGSGSVRQR